MSKGSYRKMVRLSEAQNHRCCYCGTDLFIPNLNDGRKWGPARRKRCRATFEHVTPRSKGGPNTQDNIVVACVICNSYRSSHDAEAAFTVIASMVERREHPHQIFERKKVWTGKGRFIRERVPQLFAEATS